MTEANAILPLLLGVGGALLGGVILAFPRLRRLESSRGPARPLAFRIRGVVVVLSPPITDPN